VRGDFTSEGTQSLDVLDARRVLTTSATSKTPSAQVRGSFVPVSLASRRHGTASTENRIGRVALGPDQDWDRSQTVASNALDGLRVTLSVLVAIGAFALPSPVIATIAAADTLQMSSDNLATGWSPGEPQFALTAVTSGDLGSSHGGFFQSQEPRTNEVSFT